MRMSAFRGKPEVMRHRQTDAIDPATDIHVRDRRSEMVKTMVRAKKSPILTRKICGRAFDGGQKSSASTPAFC
jgi:hypothetical protein